MCVCREVPKGARTSSVLNRSTARGRSVPPVLALANEPGAPPLLSTWCGGVMVGLLGSGSRGVVLGVVILVDDRLSRGALVL